MIDNGQNTKIFIRNLTVLDCGIWDHKRGPIGCSWSVDVTWIGKTDAEGVIVDFSEAKKLAKKVVDEQFDHRLLISSESTSHLGNGRYLCLPHGSTLQEDRFLLDTYESSLAILPNSVFDELSAGTTEQLEQIIATAILNASPNNISNVNVRLSEHQNKLAKHFFNYLHSLRLHTGNCQRFHGHSNTVEVYSSGNFDESSSALVANYLCGKYLVTEDYVAQDFDLSKIEYAETVNRLELNQKNYRWIEYSGTQGFVRVCAPVNRLVLMPNESTIENISKCIHSHLFSARHEVCVHGFEGLNKGAIYP